MFSSPPANNSISLQISQRFRLHLLQWPGIFRGERSKMRRLRSAARRASHACCKIERAPLARVSGSNSNARLENYTSSPPTLELIRGNELLLPADPPFSARREHFRCGTLCNVVRLDVVTREDNKERMDSAFRKEAPGCGLSAWQVVGGIRIRCDLPELIN